MSVKTEVRKGVAWIDRFVSNQYLRWVGDKPAILSFLFHTVFDDKNEMHLNHLDPQQEMCLSDYRYIFDRFRENSQKDLKLSIYESANLSLNQTLSRTIVTSLTTLIVVVILYFLGGEVIKYFAFALIIGVIVGTYSSIFIASPFMLYFKSKAQIIGEE